MKSLIDFENAAFCRNINTIPITIPMIMIIMTDKEQYDVDSSFGYILHETDCMANIFVHL